MIDSVGMSSITDRLSRRCFVQRIALLRRKRDA
jgi:hypothetical protein